MVSNRMYLFFVIISGLFINGIIWKLQLYGPLQTCKQSLTGLIMGCIWIGSLIILAKVRSILIEQHKTKQLLFYLNLFIIWLLSYPLIFSYFHLYNQPFALLGPILSFSKSVYLYSLINKTSQRAGWYFLPVCVWLSYILVKNTYHIFSL